MQVRHLSPNEEYFLLVLQSNREIPAFLRRRTLDQKNGILLYPDPNDSSSSSTGAHHYNACFIIQSTLLVDKNNRLIEVSMGNLSTENLKQVPEMINQALVLADLPVPEHTIFQVKENDMNAEIRRSAASLLKRACELAVANEAARKKHKRQEMDDAAIAMVIADDVEQFDKKLTISNSTWQNINLKQ